MSALDTHFYVRNPKVLWRRIADGVLIRVPEHQPGTLSGTGEALWNLLEVGGTRAQLAERLATAYSAPVGQVTADVTLALGQLEAIGLVVGLSRGGGSGFPSRE